MRRAGRGALDPLRTGFSQRAPAQNDLPMPAESVGKAEAVSDTQQLE
jgi:hypothetical protein